MAKPKAPSSSEDSSDDSDAENVSFETSFLVLKFLSFFLAGTDKNSKIDSETERVIRGAKESRGAKHQGSTKRVDVETSSN